MIDKQKKHEAFLRKVWADQNLLTRMMWRSMRRECIEGNLGRYTETRRVDDLGRTVVRYTIELNKKP